MRQSAGVQRNVGTSFVESKDSVFFSAKEKASNEKACNGKFDFWQAMKNFGHGLVSPITNMFESKKNFIAGVGTIAASAALVVATGGAAAPLLVAGGLVLGGLQVVKTVADFANAKNADDVERAFYTAGTATSVVGLSLLGAKSSLKQAGADSEALSALGAAKKCFTDIKSFAGESVEMFKTGYYKTNLYNAARPYTYAPRFRRLSSQFNRDAKSTFKQDYNEVRDILPSEFHAMLSGRPKGKISIFDKLVNRGTFGKKILKIRKNAKLSETQKSEVISQLKNNKKKFRTDEAFARNLIDDLTGTRLVVKDPIPENMNKIVSALVKAIKNDEIKITEIKNYRGPESSDGFYFTKNHIADIESAAQSKGYKIKFLDDSKKIKTSGYCATQIKIQHKSGSIGELQIRGQHVDEVANWEHIPYDLRQGKELAKGNKEMGKLLYPIKNAIKKLSDAEYKDYQKYLASIYKHARDKELGNIYPEPQLPRGYDKILGADGLRAVFKETQKINISEDKYYTMLPTSAFAAGFVSGVNGSFY